MMPSGHIRFALFPKSTVTSNLDREGRLTIALSFDGGIVNSVSVLVDLRTPLPMCR